jgi:hypothetical protein
MEELKRWKNGRFFVFEFVNVFFVIFFWIVPIKSPILPLESGSKKILCS